MTDSVPASPEGYQAIVADLPDVPKGVKINTQHPQFRDAAKAAHAAGLTQRQFSRLLAHEVQRAVAASKTAPAAPAKPAEKIPGYDKMTMRQRLLAAGKV